MLWNIVVTLLVMLGSAAVVFGSVPIRPICEGIEISFWDSFFGRKPSIDSNISIQKCLDNCYSHYDRLNEVAACLSDETGYSYTVSDIISFEDNIFP